MKSKCPDCGKTVFTNNREKQKNERYDEYETLLVKAMEAGSKAIDYTYDYPGPPARGIVMVSLDDGTSSFAHFLRERHPGMFVHRGRNTGTCWQVIQLDYRDAMNYAIAFRDVLVDRGVSVTLNSTPFTREN